MNTDATTHAPETTPATTDAPAFTVTVKRGRADRMDNRATKTYGVTLRWFARAEGLDKELLRYAPAFGGRWGDDMLTASVAASFPPGARVRASSRGWDDFNVEVFFPAARPKDIPGDPWEAWVGGERSIGDAIHVFLATALLAAADARTRVAARDVALRMAKAAVKRADEAGDFERRFAELRAERDAARHAAFRDIAESLRAPRALRTDDPEERAVSLATDPAVRVTFGSGPFAETLVYLAGEETPAEKTARESVAASRASAGELETPAPGVH